MISAEKPVIDLSELSQLLEGLTFQKWKEMEGGLKIFARIVIL